MKISNTHLTYIKEKLIKPFGFKGAYLTELWQVVCKIETPLSYGIGIGVQSILWSDSTVFNTNTEYDGNMLMYSVTEYALKLLEGKEFTDPIKLIDGIYLEVLSYSQSLTGLGKNLRETFVKNSLVAVDNALWQLYGKLRNTENLFSLIPCVYSDALCVKHKKLCNIPLITYGTTSEEIKKLLDDGAFLLKIKVGNNVAEDKDKMLEWDKNRLKEINDIAKLYKTEYTQNGKIVYYLDANGRYDNLERLSALIEYADKIGALDNIVLLEEPFEEDNKINVSSLPVRVAADESVHSVNDVEERVKLGYRAIALKAVAKTLSETLKILTKAYQSNIHCFCADLTANPMLLEYNKNIAARITTLPEIKIGMLESNGEQNYINWNQMSDYHTMAKSIFAKPKKGIYYLDDSFYLYSGGIFRKSIFYDKLF